MTRARSRDGARAGGSADDRGRARRCHPGGGRRGEPRRRGEAVADPRRRDGAAARGRAARRVRGRRRRSWSRWCPPARRRRAEAELRGARQAVRARGRGRRRRARTRSGTASPLLAGCGARAGPRRGAAVRDRPRWPRRCRARLRGDGAALAALPATDTVKRAAARRSGRARCRASGRGARRGDPRSPRCSGWRRRRRAFRRRAPAACLRRGGRRRGRRDRRVRPGGAARGGRRARAGRGRATSRSPTADDVARARARLEAPVAMGVGYDIHPFARRAPARPRRRRVRGRRPPRPLRRRRLRARDRRRHPGRRRPGRPGPALPGHRSALEGRLLAAPAARDRAQGGASAGWRVGNCDVTLAARRPEDRAARGGDAGAAGRGARRHPGAGEREGHHRREAGFVGRGEGIAAHAVALLVRPVGVGSPPCPSGIHDTLTGKKRELVPLEPGKVRFYACGPTVYDMPTWATRAATWSGTWWCATCARAARGDVRPELHRRGRQDHPARERARRGPARARRPVRALLRRGHGRAREPAPRRRAPGLGPHPADRRG